jgi:hypothetical protein
MFKKSVHLIYLVVALALAFASLAKANDPNLVGLWKFDETSGTTAADSSGYGNDGTLYGGPQWVAGHIDGALQFDGSDDYVSLPIGPLISSLSDCTISIWVNWSGTSGANQRIFDFGSSSTSCMYLTPNSQTNGALRFGILKGWAVPESQLTAPFPLPSGWHHIAIVIDGTSKGMKLYLDGEVAATGITSVLPKDLGFTTQNFLGKSQSASYPSYTGSMDEMSFYNRPFTTDEIGLIYHPPLTPLVTFFTYQGRLLDSNDAADGLYDFQFKLYDSQTSGTQKGRTIEFDDLDLIDGYFTVKLGFGDDPDIFNGDPRWLDISIRPGNSTDSFTTLSPRQEITPTPYAIFAMNGGGLILPYSGSCDTCSHAAFSIINKTTGDVKSYGGYFEARGQKGIGVQGKNSDANGVLGTSIYGHGVHGESWDGIAIYGTNLGSGAIGYLASGGFGVYGSGSRGVQGDGDAAGVWGRNILSGNVGMLGCQDCAVYSEYSYGTGSGCVGKLGCSDCGVYGKAGSGGWAGKFSGDVQVSGGVQVSGDVQVNGAISCNNRINAADIDAITITANSIMASQKNFKIDHPQDPENKYLIHSSVESAEAINLYTGNVTLDENGQATVTLPTWFQALNKDFRYQLTCIGGFAQVYIAEKITDNHFKIAGGKPGMEVSWQVTSVRKDPYALAHPMKVEEDKPEYEKGYYLHPEAYGLSKDRSIANAPKPKPTEESAWAKAHPKDAKDVQQ